MKIRFMSLVTAGVISLATTAVAQAQVQSRYVPARPTISPYFAYSAINTTGLPNYYTYVQPFQQAQYAALGTRRDIVAPTTLDSRLTLTERSINELLDRRLSQRPTTGGGAPATAATFQNYSHFYTSPATGRR